MEYGFNLHAERGKGQFVGAVDAGSPAEFAGLRLGDRIFAVNGELIAGSTHKEVSVKVEKCYHIGVGIDVGVRTQNFLTKAKYFEMCTGLDFWTDATKHK